MAWTPRMPIDFTPGEDGQIKVIADGNKSASVVSGGLVNLNNDGSTGAGLVVYTNRGADAAGRLAVFKSDNAANDQSVVRIENDGTSPALDINQTIANNTAAVALNIVSANVGDTTLGVSGVETARGTVKVTHTGTGSDANASAISIDMAGAGTLAQGIFMDYTNAAPGANVPMVNLRHSGTERFKLINKAVDTIGAANLLLFGATEPATGQGGITLPNAAVAPAAVANNGTLYVSAGALRYRGPTTDTLVAPA